MSLPVSCAIVTMMYFALAGMLIYAGYTTWWETRESHREIAKRKKLMRELFPETRTDASSQRS